MTDDKPKCSVLYCSNPSDWWRRKSKIGFCKTHGEMEIFKILEAQAKEWEKTRSLKCSFCDKSQNQVRKLIAGPEVYICDECVDLCNEILNDPAENPPAFVGFSDIEVAS